MKKYYPVDFDEKGNAVLGNAKSSPTSNGFIPTTWVPGGGSEEEGDGVKSITISPAISTTPALDTISINYDDLTEDEKVNGVTLSISAEAGQLEEGKNYTLTITPTPNWYAAAGAPPTDPGQPVEKTASVDDGELYYTFMVMNEISETPEKGFMVSLTIS